MQNRRLFLAQGVALAAAAPGLASARDSLPVYRAADLADSVGVCTHFSWGSTVYTTKFDKLLPLIVDAGIRHIREEVFVKTDYPYSYPYFQKCRALVAQGVRFCCIAARINPEPTANDFLYIEKTYDNMDGGIEYFEGVNEPNLSGYANWQEASVQMQMYLYNAVRNSAKLGSVGVVAPSYTGNAGGVVGDISAYVDYGNVHSYPGGNHPETASAGGVDRYMAAARVNTPQKPVISTETGYHSAMTTTKSHPPTPPEIIARYLPRRLMIQFMRGMTRSYLYEFADSRERGDADPESHFGLVDATATPKASYLAVKNLIAMFADTGDSDASSVDISVSGGTSVYAAVFQRSDGDYLVPIWRGVADYNPTTRTLIETSSEAVQLDAAEVLTLVDVRTMTNTGEVLTTADGRRGTSFNLTVDSAMRVARFRR